MTKKVACDNLSSINTCDENGFTKVPTEVFTKKSREINDGCAFNIYMLILDKTLGFHKYSDKISISQFVNLTGFSRPTIISQINYLEDEGHIIVIRQEGCINEFVIPCEEGLKILKEDDRVEVYESMDDINNENNENEEVDTDKLVSAMNKELEPEEEKEDKSKAVKESQKERKEKASKAKKWKEKELEEWGANDVIYYFNHKYHEEFKNAGYPPVTNKKRGQAKTLLESYPPKSIKQGIDYLFNNLDEYPPKDFGGFVAYSETLIAEALKEAKEEEEDKYEQDRIQKSDAFSQFV